ncbi:ATP synthase subunit delta [Flavimarina sp. Hel_I_48]|uniref:ATP synthase subunit delta n=1 Tax=Flavimarina sp. Hel_I_48 TaxID=1392488 RepID=UPI0004DFBD0D|nr:ATP synthase subunit delta [Flavimarina sp. Hel_I_48]
MHLEIVSPEATLYVGEASSVTVPGIDGDFQMLDNHAPIVSLLEKGSVKIKGATIGEKAKKHFKAGKEANEYTLQINSGTLEAKDNKVILLAD